MEQEVGTGRGVEPVDQEAGPLEEGDLRGLGRTRAGPEALPPPGPASSFPKEVAAKLAGMRHLEMGQWELIGWGGGGWSWHLAHSSP